VLTLSVNLTQNAKFHQLGKDSDISKVAMTLEKNGRWGLQVSFSGKQRCEEAKPACPDVTWASSNHTILGNKQEPKWNFFSLGSTLVAILVPPSSIQSLILFRMCLPR
jgi:hypothetical protein